MAQPGTGVLSRFPLPTGGLTPSARRWELEVTLTRNIHLAVLTTDNTDSTDDKIKAHRSVKRVE